MNNGIFEQSSNTGTLEQSLNEHWNIQHFYIPIKWILECTIEHFNLFWMQKDIIQNICTFCDRAKEHLKITWNISII